MRTARLPPYGGGVMVLGGYGPGGMVWPYPPPVNRMTDACENITLPQLLWRPVKIHTAMAMLQGIA